MMWYLNSGTFVGTSEGVNPPRIRNEAYITASRRKLLEDKVRKRPLHFGEGVLR